MPLRLNAERWFVAYSQTGSIEEADMEERRLIEHRPALIDLRMSSEEKPTSIEAGQLWCYQLPVEDPRIIWIVDEVAGKDAKLSIWGNRRRDGKQTEKVAELLKGAGWVYLGKSGRSWA